MAEEIGCRLKAIRLLEQPQDLTTKGAKEDENRKFTWMNMIDRMDEDSPRRHGGPSTLLRAGTEFLTGGGPIKSDLLGRFVSWSRKETRGSNDTFDALHGFGCG